MRSILNSFYKALIITTLFFILSNNIEVKGNGSKLHEDKIAQGYKIARTYFCTRTNLNEGTKLHAEKFASN